MATSLSAPAIPPRWSSLEKEVGITEEQHHIDSPSSPVSESYYDSAEEKVAVAPNMAVITRTIRQKKSRLYLDERYMSSEEALSLSPPGEDLELTDDGEDTYDVDDLLEDIFEEEAVVEYLPSKASSFVDLAVALSITPIGRARVIAIESSTATGPSEQEEEEEAVRRMSKASKRDVPFIAVPKRLRPMSIIKPIEILDDGTQSAVSPDFWTAVPMFGSAIIPPRIDSIPMASRTASNSSSSSARSVTDSSSQFSQADSNTTAPDTPPMQRRPSTASLAPTDATSSPQKGPSLIKSLGSKITTLGRKHRADSTPDAGAAANGLAASTMTTGTPTPAFARTNSISGHRRRESLGRLAGRTLSAFSTTNLAAAAERPVISRPRMEARGASERAPMLELPPFPDEMEFRIGADADVMAISKQLTRRPVGARAPAALQLRGEEREGKRRSLLGLGRRSGESARMI